MLVLELMPPKTAGSVDKQSRGDKIAEMAAHGAEIIEPLRRGHVRFYCFGRESNWHSRAETRGAGVGACHALEVELEAGDVSISSDRRR
jgi:hypothetical protein